MKNETVDSKDVFEWFPTEEPRRAPQTEPDSLSQTRRGALDWFATETEPQPSSGLDTSSTARRRQFFDDRRPRSLSSVFEVVTDEPLYRSPIPERPRRGSYPGRKAVADERVRWAGIAALVMVGVLPALFFGLRPTRVATPTEAVSADRREASVPPTAPADDQVKRMSATKAVGPAGGGVPRSTDLASATEARLKAAVTEPLGRSRTPLDAPRKTVPEPTMTAVRPTTGQLSSTTERPASLQGERSRLVETGATSPIRTPEVPAPEPRLPDPVVSPSMVVLTPPVMPREIATATPATRTSTPAPPTTISGEKVAIRYVLDRYRTAYSTLDVHGAQTVWPSVDAKALGHAFDQLEEQDLRFDSCDIYLAGARADAYCGGRTRYVPKVGNRKAREDARRWKFSLQKAEDGWLIDSVNSR